MIYVNDVPVPVTLFPDNTSQVWKLPKEMLDKRLVHVTWEFTHEGELMQLAQLKHLLEYNNVFASLTLKYLPYGRQDKQISNEATFALRSFAVILNAIDFEEVIIHDPHSKIALDLIENSRAVYPVNEVMGIAYRLEADLFCYPDDGAVTKYTGGGDVQKEIYDYPCVYGEKVRDQSTGNITSYKLIGEVKDKKILIVDDICDGGATFKLLAKDLLAAGATEVNLFVSHGIFSRGIKTLKEAGIKRVFTPDGEVSDAQNGFTYRRL